ncbi:hypothetical protein Patl1_32836 [Pistacia atlantica]|uniref:Uncharacterized protein n=1 Tax=Pistacia atlantica TaxID=434234 RepID=A0ACC1AMU5_9ROSI|nr:hypothetical protein Patl1_32836 [Pistacia atlantica]
MPNFSQALSAMAPFCRFLLFVVFVALISFKAQFVSCVTDSNDAAALQSLKDSWQNIPPSWKNSDDPCGAWDGVKCIDSRVTQLGLSTMGLAGKLSGDIGGLTELKSLILAGCSFTGDIPDEIGNLGELSFLALNSNNFSGTVPPSLGKLSNLYWLDLADNQLTGSIPVSTPNSPGLDQLKNAKHFHFNKNQLSGTISPQLFSSDMVLIHVLFDGNQLTGTIPSTLGLVQTLEVLRLDRNDLSGEVPSSLNNLSSVNELNLAHNNLTGPIPNFSQLNSLNYVDLSNNSFDPSEAPLWFSTLTSLTTLIVEHGSLQGTVPQKIFSFQLLQQVKLRNNSFNDTLNLGDTIGPDLQLVDFQNNKISKLTVDSGYKNYTLMESCMLLRSLKYELLPGSATKLQNHIRPAWLIVEADHVRQIRGSALRVVNVPIHLKGTMYFRGPSFRELSNVSVFHELEMSMWVKMELNPGSVFLQNPFFNTDDYLQVQLALFPSTGKYFNRSEIQRIGFQFSNQTYKPPKEFGPYYFIANPYPFPESHKGASLSTGVIAGIASGGALLVLGLLGIGIYAFLQKKRAERAIGMSKPFASWAPSGKDSGGAPQLKGARWFSYDELKKCTSNFSESNEIGSGGYGKGYLDPEYYMTQQLTEKSDVYSFGVVMLELVSARQPIEKGKYIVREVRMMMDKSDEEHYGLKEIMDPTIRNTGLTGFRRFLDLAMQCVEESAADRPTMSEVVKAIETLLQNDGLNTNSTSASSSATDFNSTKGVIRQIYGENLPKKDVNDSDHAFDYSGGYTLSAKVEPK